MTDLPVGWNLMALRDVAREVRVAVNAVPGDAYELWSVPSFSDRRPEYLSGDRIGSVKRDVAPGDVLLSKINPRINRVWQVGPDRGVRQIASPEWIALRVVDDVASPDYLRHFLTSPNFRSWIVGAASSATGSHARVKSAEVLKQCVPVPPLAEQHRIVVALEDQLSRLDAAIDYLKACQQRLTALRDAVFLNEYTSSSDPSSPAPATVEGLDDSSIPPIKSSWVWRRLGDVADVAGGVTKDAKKQGDPKFVSVPYLRVANVQRGRLDLTSVASLRVTPKTVEALRLQPGDVLLNEGGDRDKLGRGWVWEGQIEDCIHQNHVFRARVRDGAILPELLSHAANTIGGRWCQKNGTQSTNLASISLRKIKAMPVPVPPLDEQHAIAARIAERRAACAQLEASLVAAERREQSLRRSLLSAAFSGQLTGRASDMDRVEELAGV